MSRQSRRRPCMRVGVISDVHAHLDHLERALTILEAAGVDKVVCLGDVVEKGPQPDAVVELLDRLHIPTVQGNHDLNAVRHAQLEPRDRGMSWDTIAWLCNPGSITKGRCRLGATCAVLVLPDMTLEVHSMQGGELQFGMLDP